MLVKMESGSGGGSNSFEFVETVTYTGGGRFNVSDFSKFEVQVTAIPLTANSLKLAGILNGTETDIKTYSATTSTFEDVIPLLSGYDEFRFHTGADAQSGTFNVKATLS